METLVLKAHLDQRRETVVMAAGHANAPLRRELLAGLLDRADAEPKYARRLRMLVAACLETIPDVPSAARDRVDRCVSRLIPPRNLGEARRLAAAGEDVLGRLPESLEGLSETQAVATVRTAWLVNGSAAIDVLARYAADPRARVQAELAGAWSYFEPHTYAEKVLADAPLNDGELTIDDPALLPALRSLRHMARLEVDLPRAAGLECLRGVPALTKIKAKDVRPESLELLAEHRGLESVDLSINGIIEDVSALLELPSLRKLELSPAGFGSGLGFVTCLPQLKVLILDGLGDVRDLSPITAQRALERLDLRDCGHLTDLDVLGPHEALGWLALEGADLGHDGCAQIAAAFPQVNVLCLIDSEWAERLDGLVGMSREFVWLKLCPRLRDLGPLAMFPRLLWLNLDRIPFTDLNPLAGLSELRTLALRDAPDDVDLAPLAGLRDLDLLLIEGQRVLGADRLHKSTKIIWRPRIRA